MAVTPLISLEDHFVSAVCQGDEVAEKLALHQFPGSILQKLVEVGPTRIHVMTEGGVNLQVISHIPVVLGVEECRKTNDQLALAVRENELYFRAFATLPMGDPASLATELERCVRELDFLGALIPNHANGTYYDGPEYLPMWKAAERLDVPIYLHPCPPSGQQLPLFHGNYSEEVSFALSTHAWDWHANCGVHFLKLYASGLFDQCLRLKLVLGHLGEMLPFMLGRVERKLSLTKDSKTLKKSFSEAYKDNVWVTTSGMFDVEPFKLVLQTTAIDRIMFSVDYPFESTTISTDFMKELRKLKLVSEQDFARIGYKNAEALLGIKIAA